MPTQTFIVIIGAHHHGQCIPANQRANTALHKQVAGHAAFIGRFDGIAKWRGDRRGYFATRLGRAFGHHFYQERRALRTLLLPQYII